MALSNRERNIVERGIRFRGDAAELLGRWPAPGSEVFHFVQAAAPGAPEAVALCAGEAPDADLLALMGRAVASATRPRGRLLTGQQIMTALGLPPGPEIGRLLDAVELARADGRLSTPEEALAWLRESRGARPDSNENPVEEP
jgi:hypothetical protein